MAAERRDRDDPFYFSDTIRDIDEEAPFIRLQWFQQSRFPVALLSVDAISGEEFVCAGYVKKTDYKILEIESIDKGDDVAIRVINVDFYPLKREDAPARLKAITTDAYNAGMRFHTDRAECYLLVQCDIKGDE